MNDAKRSDPLEPLSRIPPWAFFALHGVPKVFEWLRWSLMLAVVAYAAEVAEKPFLEMLFQVLLILLGLHYFIYFRQVLFRVGGVMEKRTPLNATLSAILAAMLYLATWLAVVMVVSAVAKLRGLQ